MAAIPESVAGTTGPSREGGEVSTDETESHELLALSSKEGSSSES